MGGKSLEIVTEVRDLGILLDSGLTLVNHIDKIVQRAFKMLGFILRMTKDFRDVSSVILVYNNLVRSILEYGSEIWNPRYAVHVQRIESVQRKFVKIINFRYNNRQIMSYNESLRHYRIESLEMRREFFDICFIFKVINSEIDSQYCLEFLNLNCRSYHLRVRHLFYNHLSECNTNFYLNSPLICM